MRKLNLLTEKLFSVRKGRERFTQSLPEVLWELSRGSDIDFRALRRHQHHAWYAFLVQLAAIAKTRKGEVYQTAQ